ncbi:MAG: HAMP domain-containing methyl-accepting chemotaxis protein, partial [Bacteriovorax sp.]
MKKWFTGIRLKLLSVSVLAVISLLIVGITGFVAVSSLADKLDVAYNQRLQLSEELGKINAGIHASFRWLWVSLVNDNNLKERQKFIEKTKTEIKNLDQSIQDYMAIPKSAKAQKLINQKLLPNWGLSKNIFKEIIAELEKNNPQASEKAKVMIMTKLREASAPVSEVDEELKTIALTTNKRIVTESLSYAHTAKIVSISIVLLAGVLSFVICIRIASQLVTILSTLSSDLNSSSMQVSAAAEQIASSSEQLSQATVEQASSLEETSSSIQEMSSMVAKTSDNAIQASRVSVESQQNALKGKEVVQNMIFSINEINDSNKNIMVQIEQSNKKISEIVQVIAEIGNKTKVINDIVFQTKLLSFNAS